MELCVVQEDAGLCVFLMVISSCAEASFVSL